MKQAKPSTPHEKLRQRIKSKHLTQIDAAARLNVSPSYLSEILNGRPPGMGVAAKIQREFGLAMIEWVSPLD